MTSIRKRRLAGNDATPAKAQGGRKRVIVIDDDPDAGDILCESARMAGFEPTQTTTFAQFKAALLRPASMILVDLVMPGTDGIELLRYLAQQRCRAGIVLTSGLDVRVLESAERVAKAMGLRVLGNLPKPMRVAELSAHLKRFGSANVDVTSPVAGPTASLSQDELDHAIDDDQLAVHYQPQIDLRTMAVVGVEALVRWNHPRYGLVFPGSFLGVAHDGGLIDKLTIWVLRRVLGDSKRWTGDDSLPTCSVNFSAKSFHDLSLPDRIGGLVAAHEIAASRLIVELTETDLVDELTMALDILTRLRMKNIQLSIDDFGMGYSTLQQLQLIPATELKIDRTFVSAAENDDTARIMVQKTIELGHELGVRVVAEGVETLSSFALLRRYDCDVAQGYHFSRPLPLNEFESWRESWDDARA